MMPSPTHQTMPLLAKKLLEINSYDVIRLETENPAVPAVKRTQLSGPGGWVSTGD